MENHKKNTDIYWNDTGFSTGESAKVLEYYDLPGEVEKVRSSLKIIHILQILTFLLLLIVYSLLLLVVLAHPGAPKIIEASNVADSAEGN